MYRVLIVTLAFLMSCGSSENRDQVNTKKEEVMRIHDVTMEKMGEMAKLKTKLKQFDTSDSTQQIKIKSAVENLELADKLMWDWMHNYHHEIVDTSHVDTALKYLEDQHQKVIIVEEKINSSIKNGQALL